VKRAQLRLLLRQAVVVADAAVEADAVEQRRVPLELRLRRQAAVVRAVEAVVVLEDSAARRLAPERPASIA
jgi:hypothetical protein